MLQETLVYLQRNVQNIFCYLVLVGIGFELQLSIFEVLASPSPCLLYINDSIPYWRILSRNL